MPRTLRTSNPVRRGHPLNQGCVAWWLTLPHTQGTATWYNLIGSYHGSLVGFNTSYSGWGATHRPGGYGHVLFNGNEYAQCRTGAIIAGKSNWAMAAWVSTTISNGAGGRVIYSESSGTADIFKLSFADRTANPGFTVTLRNDANNLLQIFGPTPINDGLWHRGLAVYSGSTVSIFRDGRLDATGTWTGPDSFTGPINSQIGGESGGTSLVGSIDGVKLWTGNSLAVSNPAAFAALDYDQSRRGDPDTLNYL